MDHPKTSGWPERIWRNVNQADIARGIVPGAKSLACFGEFIATGITTDHILWETGMPAVLTVPNSVQLSFVSSGADTRRLRLVYIDSNLLQRTEVITLNGTTPVLSTATDARFVNGLYSLDGPLATTVTASHGGVTYARINSGDVQFSQAVYRVPADKRLMITSVYAGAVSGTAAAKVVIKTEVTFFNGDSFANSGILHPVTGVAIQDNAVTLPIDPFQVPPGEIVALTFKCDKAADVVGGFFGWTENV